MANRVTRRQLREIEFHEEWARQGNLPQTLTFAALSGERRPWNSYWFVYHTVQDLLKSRHYRHLLDFGCGCGVQALHYAKMGYEVKAFDISETLIRHAQRLAARYGLLGRVDFSVQAAESLVYDCNSFDVVVGVDILHHVEIESAIREVRRVLRPGGLAIFREPVETGVFGWFRNTRLLRTWFPSGVSYLRYVTGDERPLSTNDLAVIRHYFPQLGCHHFRLLSRMRRVLPSRRKGRASLLEMADYVLFKGFPFLRCLGGHVVLCLPR